MALILFFAGMFLLLESIAMLNLMRGGTGLLCRVKYLLSSLVGLCTVIHALRPLHPDESLWHELGLVVALSLFVLYEARNRYRIRQRLDALIDKVLKP